MQTRKDLINIMLAIALVMGFIFIATFTVYYIRDKYGISDSCGCMVSLPMVMILLASLGVFVGTMTYYFIAKAFFTEKKTITVNIEKTLDFLDNEERLILKALIKSNGSSAQNKLPALTGIDSVKLFRRLANLEKKGIIKKQKKGMTNNIDLNEPFTELFLKVK